MKEQVVIEAENISRSYDDKIVLSRLNISVFADDKIFLTGDNGVGKTTLLRILAGQLTNQSGQVSYHQKAYTLKDVKRIVSYLPSDPPPLFPRMKGKENMDLFHSLSLKGLSAANRKSEIEHYIKLKNSWSDELNIFKEALDIPTYKCSMGMKQTLSIFRALSRNCDIYILDEPFQSLSQSTINFVIKSLKECFLDKVFIITSHQQIDRSFFNRELKILNGEISV